MEQQSSALAYSMTSIEADYSYPCFTYLDVEIALDTIAWELSLHREYTFDVPNVFTYGSDEFLLLVRTTPRVYYGERMCFGLSGALISRHSQYSEMVLLPNTACDSTTPAWRKNPKDFLLDVEYAIDYLRSNRYLSRRDSHLLGPGYATRHAEQLALMG